MTTFDANTVIQQLDEVIKIGKDLIHRSQHNDLSDHPLHVLVEATTTMLAAISRFAPNGSVYLSQADAVVKKGFQGYQLKQLVGVASSLRTAYASGYLQTIQELVHADLFGDFLQMAGYFLAEKYKDPAAVIIGGVLEEHLRKLCGRNGIAFADAAGKPKKASIMNDDLVKSNVYNNLHHKNVIAWLDLRNKAAHGKYTEYDQKQVENLLLSVQDFAARFPA